MQVLNRKIWSGSLDNMYLPMPSTKAMHSVGDNNKSFLIPTRAPENQ